MLDGHRRQEAHEKKLKALTQEDHRERELRGKKLAELVVAMQKVANEEISEKTKTAPDFVWEQVTPPMDVCSRPECKSPGVGHFRIKSTRPECGGLECASRTEVRCEEHKLVFELGSIRHVCRKLHKHEWERYEGVSIYPQFQCRICGLFETR